MRSVAISTKTYFDRGKEIDAWLQENEAKTRDSIIQPLDVPTGPCARVIITFEDPDLALLFKLIWG